MDRSHDWWTNQARDLKGDSTDHVTRLETAVCETSRSSSVTNYITLTHHITPPSIIVSIVIHFHTISVQPISAQFIRHSANQRSVHPPLSQSVFRSSVTQPILFQLTNVQPIIIVPGNRRRGDGGESSSSSPGVITHSDPGNVIRQCHLWILLLTQ